MAKTGAEKAFAERLKAAREILGDSQQDAAHTIGVSVSSVSNWEQASYTPGGRLQKAAARAYIERAERIIDGQRA